MAKNCWAKGDGKKDLNPWRKGQGKANIAWVGEWPTGAQKGLIENTYGERYKNLNPKLGLSSTLYWSEQRELISSHFIGLSTYTYF